MSSVPEQHKAYAPETIRCAVITVSDTRTRDTDTGGDTLAQYITDAKQEVVFRKIIADEPEEMRPLLEELRDRDDVDAVLLTGGTGLSSRDQTFETVSEQITKPLPGYGELFRMLSYEDIGPAAMLSRAIGGLMGKTLVMTMPGSPAAVRLAMEKVILPELGHLIGQARR